MRLKLLGTVASLALLSSAALAQQADGPSPDQQALIQKFQDVRMQVMQNMQKQGIDPMQFFQDIGKKMQDGTFDMNDMNQELIDKGLIEQSTISDLQNQAQKVTLNDIKKQLGMTDEEWNAIVPQVQAVMAAQGPAGMRQGGMGGMGGIGGFAGSSAASPASVELTKARRALHDAVKDPATPDPVLTEKLKSYHDAKAGVLAALRSAQKDLRDLLTVKQEAVMVKLGILD